MKKIIYFLVMLISVVFLCVACGDKQGENMQVPESEVEIKIIDATDLLLKVWMDFDEIVLDVMGGHYSDPAMGAPAKYDLSQADDLVRMYCVPESQISGIDDAATIIDLYNAARFTACAFHLTDTLNQELFIKEMEQQITGNEWHGEVPEKVLVVGIQEDYVVAVYGREEFVNEFEKILKKFTK